MRLFLLRMNGTNTSQAASNTSCQLAGGDEAVPLNPVGHCCTELAGKPLIGHNFRSLTRLAKLWCLHLREGLSDGACVSQVEEELFQDIGHTIVREGIPYSYQSMYLGI